MSKCRNAKNAKNAKMFKCPNVKTPKCQNVKMPKMPKCKNAQMPRCQIIIINSIYGNFPFVDQEQYKIVKNMSFLKVSAKTDCRFELSVIFCVFQHRSKFIFDIFLKMTFFDIRIVKNCIFWMFWRLGTMPKWFFIAKSFLNGSLNMPAGAKFLDFFVKGFP